MNFGSIRTPIIPDGLVFNTDPANRASYVDGDIETLNTINSTQSGSISGATFDNQFGPSWNFDGTNDRITYNLGDTLAGSQHMTIGLWMRLDSYSSKGQFGIQTATNQDFECNTYSNQLRFNLRNNSNTYAYVSNFQNIVATGEWFYYVGWFDGTQSGNARTKLYINGVNVPFDVQNGTAPSSLPNFSSTDVFYLGRAVSAAWYNDGRISNTHIYNRSLSDSEILHNYNALKGRFGL